MSYYLGEELKNNLMAGRPTRTKSAGDYSGMAIPPCGDFAKTSSPPRPPWMQRVSVAALPSQKTILDQEIACFVEYMTPTTQEIATRKDLVKRFTNLIASFGVGATVRPVGSYVTGLYLPTSDIDMVLTFNDRFSLYSATSYSKTSLYGIYAKIVASGFASKVDNVMNALVPLIRITDKITGIEIDLTASDTHSVKATQAVEKWLQKDTELVKMLVLVLKIFLSIRKCGTTYTGGVNSYVLVWMVVAWVKLEWPKMQKATPRVVAADLSALASAFGGLSMHTGSTMAASSTIVASSAVIAQAQIAEAKTQNFGAALTGFLKFYGHDFDYFNKAVKIEPTPCYQTKVYPYSRYAITQIYLLSIFDPANASVDMGAKAYAIKHVQASFQEAYRMLVASEKPGNPIGHEGILGKVLGGDFTKFVEKRNKLARK